METENVPDRPESICVSSGLQFLMDRYKNDPKAIQSQAVIRRCSTKLVYLKNSQSLQENTCGGVSFQ